MGARKALRLCGVTFPRIAQSWPAPLPVSVAPASLNFRELRMKALRTAIIVNLAILLGAAGAVAADAPTSSESDSVYTHYVKIQTALAADSVQSVSENAKAMAKAISRDKTAWPASLADATSTLSEATDVKAARAAFKSVSKSLIEYWSSHEDLRRQYRRAYCPMAEAAWLQTGSEISNPYMGKQMQRCGEFLPLAKAGTARAAACPANPEMQCPGTAKMSCTGQKSASGCCVMEK